MGVNQKTWRRALRASERIIARHQQSEGLTWLIHRGWLAGYKAGLAASVKGRPQKVRR